jgi:Zn-dependent protease
MFGIPAATPYDLRFRLLGIPVRVHPLFWLISGIMGWYADDLRMTLVWMVAVFISIMVHEFGHGLTNVAFGQRPFIILYGMGGLCAAEGRQKGWQRFLVVLAGPLAGFALFLLTLVLTLFVLRNQDMSPLASRFVSDMLMINLFWSILNLLPILPLDGGQLTGIVLSGVNRHNGMRYTHVISLLVSGLVAVWFFSRSGGLAVNGILFALLALYNFQALQALHQKASYGSAYDDSEADWWKR